MQGGNSPFCSPQALLYTIGTVLGSSNGYVLTSSATASSSHISDAFLTKPDSRSSRLRAMRVRGYAVISSSLFTASGMSSLSMKYSA